LKTSGATTAEQKQDELMRNSYPVARGNMDKEGKFTNAYTGAEKGPIILLQGPDGIPRMVASDYYDKVMSSGVQAKPGTKPVIGRPQPGPAPGKVGEGTEPPTAPPASPDASTGTQSGELQVDKSRRLVNGKWYVWRERNGKLGWIPE
jgi:hypothetical protein